MNLEDELQRLFSDDRLELPVRPEAEDILARGIGRRRRRRAAAAGAAGALMVAGLIGTGVALTGVRSTDDFLPATRLPVTTVPVTTGAPVPPSTGTSVTPPSPTSSSTGTPSSSSKRSTASTRPSGKPSGGASATAPPPSTSVVLGPYGWGRLRLGMSESEAVATGEFDLDEGVSGAPCHRYWLANTHGAPVDISPAYGVARITAKSGVHTPEGIGVGSTDDEVRAAYPGATFADYEFTVPVPGNPKAVYVLNTDSSEKIFALRLELKTSDC